MKNRLSMKKLRDRLRLKRIKQKISEQVKKRLHIEQNRIRWEHVRKTTWALFLTLPFLLTEWSGRAFNLYQIFPPIDRFIHFFFGMAFASVSSLIYRKSPKVMGSWVVIISFMWEGLEKIGDFVYPNQPSYQIDIFFWDGTWDIIMNILGAVMIYFIMKKTGLLEHKV